MSATFKPIPRSTPEKEAVSTVRIADFERQIDSGNVLPRGYMLLRNGKVVSERFWEPYKPDSKVWFYSLSKSFTSTGIGIAVDEGLLSVDDRVIDHFPDKAPSDPSENLRAMTVKHLLSMNTGHGTEPFLPEDEIMSHDWVEYFLHQPIEYAPGSKFLYNSMATYVLSAILQKVSGVTLLEYLRPRLFEPLGFDEVFFDFVPPDNINTGGWGMMARLEDVAKLGQLYLDGGMYNGKRIVSQQWVTDATSKVSDNNRPGEPTEWCMGYGYQFWCCRHGAFRGDGAYGQYCIVMPLQNMVLALMSETSEMQSVVDIVWQCLLPAAIGASAHPGSPEATGTHTDIQSKINGARFHASRNNEDTGFLGFDSMQFDFSNNELHLKLFEGEKSTTLLCGHGRWAYGTVEQSDDRLNVWKISFFPLFGLGKRPIPTAAWYEWREESTLYLHWVYMETPHRGSAELSFDPRGKYAIVNNLHITSAPDETLSGIAFEHRQD